MSGHVYCVCVYRSAAVGDDLLLWVYLTCGQICCVYNLLPSSTGTIPRGEEELKVVLYRAFMARGVMAERTPICACVKLTIFIAPLFCIMMQPAFN